MPEQIRLISFLGTTSYIPMRYSLDGRDLTTPRTFVQSAICELLRSEIAEVTILTTAEAAKKHWPSLIAELGRIGLGEAAIHQVRIPDGHSEDELWEIFGKVGESLDGCRGFVFDITHGFRSLPATGLFSLAFYLNVLDVRLERILYGAFEACVDADGHSPSVPEGQTIFKVVGSMSVEQRDAVVAPIFDLTPMQTVTRWAEAAAEWERTGRARGIVELALPATQLLRQQLRQDRPQALTDLPERLALLDDALTLVHHEQIAPRAKDVQQRLAEAAEQSSAAPRLAPFGRLVREMGASVEPLTHGEFPSVPGGAGYFRGQLAAAQWLSDHGRIVEAFSLLREVVTSVAVWVVDRAGMKSLPSPQGKPYLLGSTGFRTRSDRLLTSLTGAYRESTDTSAEEEPREHEALPADQAQGVQSLLLASPELGDRYAKAWIAVQDLRNKLNHCWTGDHSAKKLKKSTMGEVQRELQQSGLLVDQLIAEVEKLDPPASAREVPEASPQTTASRFVNLTNHPVESWSREQLDAARDLGLGEPEDLPGGMPLVPPLASGEDVLLLAEQIVAQVGRGVSGVALAGEPTLVVALSGLLQTVGVRCFAATTERRVTRQQTADGAVVKESEFRFVRWREYIDG
ncbi:MAG: TM1812 family CRISPR-associated protein [Myxococcota bacterium]|jgi:hypothetical protein|nr:TM1812 family CRISPR-associated protein [Myxococcota bacterium]